MTKIEALLNKFETLDQNSPEVLLAVSRKNFITLDEIKQQVNLDSGIVEKCVTELLELGLIEDSFESYILSDSGMELILDAAVKYADTNNIVFESTARRKPRDISGSMNTDKEFIESILVEKSIEIKEIRLNRSNYEVAFSRNKMRLRQIEIKNDGSLRIVCNKPKQHVIDVFVGIGMQIKISASGSCYIDGIRSEQLITQAIDIIASELTQDVK
ncbi:MotA-like activator of middle period transcription [Pseudomonas phage PspYZU05]|uniref:Activator of middle period transcription n=1 Tax=Pseudomonas phage PspYZU05 TaxID=1983556 RepID=A0A2U7NBX4_9CAUD|nr:MotA-like activator of middle period transcription [Pseudomonas phage PspYZU05]ASD52139.1 activator of middle period transcription [Pseudomonas phage PspYZU05]